MFNNQQLNTTDDFSEFDFDFDENDVLVKDGDKENKKSRKQAQTPDGAGQEIKADASLKKIPVIVKPVDLFKRSVPVSDALITRERMGVPLDLKRVKTPKVEKRDIEENLKKQASMQKEKIKALEREGEGLVYNEQDEEEIEKFKKSPLARSGFNIDALIRELIGRLSIVSTLKIDLINRLKNIISSFLRDVRTLRATEELLQRSVESGGLNLSSEHSEQVMNFIKDEYKRIHSGNFRIVEKKVECPQKEESKDGRKSDFVEPVKLIESPKEEVEAVSKKTAKEAQVGVFSDEITSSYKKNVKKTQNDTVIHADLKQWEDNLVIPDNLRTPEISSPKNAERLMHGASDNAKKKETGLAKKENEEEFAKNVLMLKGLRRKEVLKSLDEVLAQYDNKVQELKKEKTSWISRMFKKKKDTKVESSKPIDHGNIKIQKHKSTKTMNQPAFVSSFVSSSAKATEDKKAATDKEINKTIKQESDESGEVPSFTPQIPSVVRRVVFDKTNFDNRPKMEDVKVVHPHLVGPIEELAEMTLVDFRRLGTTTQDSIDKIREKIDMAAKAFFNQKIAAINAWRKSEPNQIYIELGRQSLLKKIPVEDLINRYNLENRPVLTKEEFNLINQLNKELRY